MNKMEKEFLNQYLYDYYGNSPRGITIINAFRAIVNFPEEIQGLKEVRRGLEKLLPQIFASVPEIIDTERNLIYHSINSFHLYENGELWSFRYDENAYITTLAPFKPKNKELLAIQKETNEKLKSKTIAALDKELIQQKENETAAEEARLAAQAKYLKEIEKKRDAAKTKKKKTKLRYSVLDMLRDSGNWIIKAQVFHHLYPKRKIVRPTNLQRCRQFTEKDPDYERLHILLNSSIETYGELNEYDLIKPEHGNFDKLKKLGYVVPKSIYEERENDPCNRNWAKERERDKRLFNKVVNLPENAKVRNNWITYNQIHKTIYPLQAHWKKLMANDVRTATGYPSDWIDPCEIRLFILQEDKIDEFIKAVEERIKEHGRYKIGFNRFTVHFDHDYFKKIYLDEVPDYLKQALAEWGVLKDYKRKKVA